MASPPVDEFSALSLQEAPAREERRFEDFSVLKVRRKGRLNSFCNYCKVQSRRQFYLLQTEHLHPKDYETLADRGWTRYGLDLYYPVNKASCCPQFQIRLDTAAFRPSKHKRQNLSRFNRFINGEWGPAQVPSSFPDPDGPVSLSSSSSSSSSEARSKNEEESENSQQSHPQDNPDAPQEDARPSEPEESVVKVDQEETGDRVDGDHEEKEERPKQLDPEACESLSSREAEGEAELKDSENEPSKEESKEPEKSRKHDLKITIRPAYHNPEAERLYNTYMTEIHQNNDASYSGSFSTNPFTTRDQQPLERDYEDDRPLVDGAYHFEYRIDGRLVMVCSCDITSNYFFSNFCFYDPAIRFLKPGHVSALLEIQWAQRHSIPWYYMLYFVPNNSRIAYKLEYQPTYILCTESFRWVPILETPHVHDPRFFYNCNPRFYRIPEAAPETVRAIISHPRARRFRLDIERALAVAFHQGQKLFQPNEKLEWDDFSQSRLLFILLRAFVTLYDPDPPSRLYRILDRRQIGWEIKNRKRSLLPNLNISIYNMHMKLDSHRDFLNRTISIPLFFQYHRLFGTELHKTIIFEIFAP